MQCRTANGKAFRILVVIDEYSRECLALHVAWNIRSERVMHVLADLFLAHGVPDNLRSDNGPEFIANKLLDGEMFMTMKEAEIVIENWCKYYNGRRPHRSLNGRPPAPLTFFAPPMGGAMGPLWPPQELSAIRAAEAQPHEACH